MPNFWDSLKSSGVQLASTAGEFYQSALGTFSAAANERITQTSLDLQNKIADHVKPAAAKPAPVQPASLAATPQQASLKFGLIGILVAALIIFIVMRNK